MNKHSLPLGKLPAPLLADLLKTNRSDDPRVIIGPGIGLDCAVVEFGDRLLVLKSDPITFVTEQIGWYLVQVNANDIATTGARPRWMLVTLLLPEQQTTNEIVGQIFTQISEACLEIGVVVIGGHTEITHGLDRVIVLGTLIGEVMPANLVTPLGASPGDRLLLTKGMAIEATAILAREFGERLAGFLDSDDLEKAANYLKKPGISVLEDAQVALGAGKVTAMHDPTEGGVATALWELSEACGHTIVIDPGKIPISSLTNRICEVLDIDPLAAISSGALLLTTPEEDSGPIRQALEDHDINCVEIGRVELGPVQVLSHNARGHDTFLRPTRDEIARIFDS